MSARGRAVAALVALLVAASVVTGAAPAHAQTGTILRYSVEPRVTDLSSPSPVAMSVTTEGATSAQIRFLDGTTVDMTAAGGSVFTATLSGAQVVDGYETGEMRNFIGSIRAFVSGTQTDSAGLGINIKDETMPDVSVTQVAPDVQTGPHVVNMRMDTLYDPDTSPGSVLQQFYGRMPDNFDFAVVVSQVRFESYFAGRFESVRNSIQGLGMGNFDSGSDFGSAAELEGVLIYPRDSSFDPGAYLFLHEVSHRWMNFSDLPLLTQNVPHWPLSDLVVGVMGDGLGYFGFDLTPLSGGNYRLDRGGSTGFNDLELYLLGLVPPDQVGSHFVFQNQNQPQAGEGVIWSGPVTTFTINDVIASNGARQPGSTQSQKDFRVAAIVLSQGRLLTPMEMAYFDHMAARAEARAPFTVRTSSTDPFFVATGGRGTITTSLGEVTAPTISSFSPTSGPAGTTVVIAGTELMRATAVSFGGTAAGFTVDSNARLTATVPSGAASGPISVTTPSGAATSASSFTVGGAPPSPSPSATPSPSPSPPTTELHVRGISIRLVRKASGLRAKGAVTVGDGFTACVVGVGVKIQRRAAGKWKSVTRTATTGSGAYAVGFPDRRGTYRALAPKLTLATGDVCTRAATASATL